MTINRHHPIISVVIPAYNTERTIVDCLTTIHRSSLLPDEIIVVDDGSNDNTFALAEENGATVIRLPGNKGRIAARRIGYSRAKGDIIINIDQDVVITEASIRIIVEHFMQNPTCMALTGRLSARSHYKNFFSVYKHLYMHYRFSNLPCSVHFLYGSIFALRREVDPTHIPASLDNGDDTEMGLYLHTQGKEIHFIKDLMVDHYKYYSFSSLLKNDFLVPMSWTLLALRYVSRVSMKEGRFAHASLSQTLMIALTVIIFIMSLWAVFGVRGGPVNGIMAILLVVWFCLNYGLFATMFKHMKKRYYIAVILFTFIDSLVMASGMMFGLAKGCISYLMNNRKFY
ncbi:MAG: glycosyltransferase family 2 protein [Candidatus Omnitrophica bacterium]|nr:glycosyltransferase family 2 protein [Candidatus Omnitrophota bacterium]